MSQYADIFSWQRFARVFLNDLMSLQARRVGFASLGLVGVGLLNYLGNASESPDTNSNVAVITFALLLMGGGHIFTSMIFNDMHHPLERFQYLMLPCSSLERFMSRYLITAPLYVVYAIVLYKLFETVANFAIRVLFDVPGIPPLDLGAQDTRFAILGYFGTHVFVYCGAIWFRSYALIKTLATGMIFWMVCALLAFLAVRLLYWDSFISLFEVNPEGPFPDIHADFLFNDDGTPTRWTQVGLTLFLGWVLFLAYAGLAEHEVQDGL